MFSARNLLFAAVLFSWLFALAYSSTIYSMPITSDAFERSRIASLVISNQQTTTPYSPRAAYNYPPLFDFFLATVSTIFSADFFTGLVISSVLFSVCFAALAFCFAKEFSDENAGLFAVLLVLLSPWLFFRLQTPISETLGLLLFLAATYSYYKNRFSLSFLFFVLLLFSHYRSFASAAAVIVAYSILNHKQLLKPLAYTLALPSLAYLFFIPRAPLLQNPWVMEAGIFDYYLPLLLSLCSLGLLITFLKAGISKKQFLFFASLSAAPLALGALAPFAFRQLVYLFPFVIFFAAQFLSGFYAQLGAKNYSSSQRPALPPSRRAILKPLFAATLLAFVLLSLNSALSARTPPISASKANSLSGISVFDAKVVLAPFYESYAIPYYANKKVVAGAFLEGQPDGASRAQDSHSFFHNASTSQRFAILDKYSVGLVCMEPSQYPAVASWLTAQSRLQKKFSQPPIECWG